MSTNPLLDQTGIPAFDKIKPEHVAPAVDALTKAVSYTHLTLPTIYSV